MKGIGQTLKRNARAGLVASLAMPIVIACTGSPRSQIVGQDPRFGSVYGQRYGIYPGSAGAGAYNSNFTPASRTAYNGFNAQGPMTQFMQQGMRQPVVQMGPGNPCMQPGTIIPDWKKTGKNPCEKTSQNDNSNTNNNNNNNNSNNNTADSNRSPAGGDGEEIAIGMNGTSFASGMGICTEEEASSGIDADGDGLYERCEAVGKSKGFQSLNDYFFNGYKVAARNIPKAETDAWWKKLNAASKADKKLQKSFTTVTAISEIIQNTTKYAPLNVLTDPNGDIRMPSVSNVGLVPGGNGSMRLTIGGIPGLDDPNEGFAVGKLPAMARDAMNLNQDDGFIYVVESFLNYPSNYDPVIKLMGTGSGVRMSGIAVFVNGNHLLDSFTTAGPVPPDYGTPVKPVCKDGRDCHLVVVFMSKRKSNDRHFYEEAVMINLRPNDNRGPEPLPTEIGSMVPWNLGYKFWEKLGDAPALPLLADPEADADLIQKCRVAGRDWAKDMKIKTKGADGGEIESNLVDLTSCPALFITKGKGTAAGSVDDVINSVLTGAPVPPAGELPPALPVPRPADGAPAPSSEADKEQRLPSEEGSADQPPAAQAGSPSFVDQMKN